MEKVDFLVRSVLVLFVLGYSTLLFAIATAFPSQSPVERFFQFLVLSEGVMVTALLGPMILFPSLAEKMRRRLYPTSSFSTLVTPGEVRR